MKYEEETISFGASSVRRHPGRLISVLIYPHLRGRRDTASTLGFYGISERWATIRAEVYKGVIRTGQTPSLPAC